MAHPCVIGRDGLVQAKVEGDMKTPIGRFPIRAIYYRPDRMIKPESALPVYEILPNLGWCDDPADGAYNKVIEKPFARSHEDLWRQDNLYDLFIVVGYNDDPPVAGRGSAIFIHICPPSGYTAGCIGLDKEALLSLPPHLTLESTIEILS